MEGSVGPVIRVVVVIIILGLMAGVVGRMCSGRSVMGRGNYVFEAWVETKCSTCIDGRIDPPQPQRRHPLTPPPMQTAATEVEGEMESDVQSSDESLPEPEQRPPPHIQLPEHQHHQQQQQQQIHPQNHHPQQQQHQRHHHPHHQKQYHDDRPESSKSRQTM